MTVWDLEPGSERPVAPPRPKWVGNLTVAEMLRRCERLGARVVPAGGGGHRVFPPDPLKAPVSIPSRLAHGRGHLNVITALLRAGLDVTAEPVKETTDMAPRPSDVAQRKANGSPVNSAATASPAAEWREQAAAMLEMLAEAEVRDRQLAERLDRLTARLDATPGAPPERDPNADLDDAILALLRKVGLKITLEIVTANLPDSPPAKAVADRLDALVDRDAVAYDESGGHRFYWPTRAAT